MQYEFKIIEAITPDLDKLGLEGWEVVSMTGMHDALWVLLKRKIRVSM